MPEFSCCVCHSFRAFLHTRKSRCQPRLDPNEPNNLAAHLDRRCIVLVNEILEFHNVSLLHLVVILDSFLSVVGMLALSFLAIRNLNEGTQRPVMPLMFLPMDVGLANFLDHVKDPRLRYGIQSLPHYLLEMMASKPSIALVLL